MDHPDFRVGGKIFATLWKGDGVLMLKPDQQAAIIEPNPLVFAPASGAWGRRGATTIHLELADERTVRKAMTTAYRNRASNAEKNHEGREVTRALGPSAKQALQQREAPEDHVEPNHRTHREATPSRKP